MFIYIVENGVYHYNPNLDPIILFYLSIDCLTVYLTTFYSSIGVGPDYPIFKDELANMASSKNHTFHVDDLDKLEEIRKELVQYICGAQGR